MTRTNTIRLVVARALFFSLMDGWGSSDPKLVKLVWKRIDRELKSAGLTRDSLAPMETKE